MKLARHTATGTAVLLSLAFDSDALPHGGRHRSRQLEETFEEGGWVLEELADRRPSSRIITLIWGIYAYLRLAFFRPLCIESLRIAGADYYRLTRYLNAYPEINTLVMEGTGNTALMMVPAARQRQVRVVVVPQNIESLAPYDGLFTHRVGLFARFRQEIRLLRGIKAAFCISTEEEWLLRLFGLPAFYLPYRPPAVVAARLAGLRPKRQPNSGFGFLMLGSVTNQPTLKGFRTLYRMLTQELCGFDVRIHLAGRGTEQLRKEFVDPRIVLHGSVSDEQLDELMIKADGLLLMQAPTTGFLTRVIEARCAGVPIIGNVDAVKGLRELAGVHVYYQASDLRKLLAGIRDTPLAPAHPTNEIELFQRTLLDVEREKP